MIITLDFETRSYSNLKSVGQWVYSQHETTQVICLCWAMGDGEVQEWWPGMNETDACPPELAAAIEAGELFEAHNVSFEISVWLNVMVARHGWPEIPLKQWRDSMAAACYFAMPPALDRLCRALGIGGKDPGGSKLITKYSKLHLKNAKPEIPDDDFFRFVDYCKQDVRIEREASEILGDLPEREIPIFLLNLETNLRGLRIDVEGIEAATAVVDQRSEELTTEFRALTGLNPTQGDKLHVWFAAQGVALENLQADYLENLLEEGHVPAGDARRALQIRLEINKASTKKLDAMARNTDRDGRARFQTRYHGAVTGRETGAGFQPLNLNRGFEKMDPAQLVRDIGYRDPVWLDAVYGDAMDAVSKAARFWIQAAPGKVIYSGDFVSIEAVLNACLAGEDWKIEAFRSKAKIYELAADKIYGLPPGTVTKETEPEKRQDGKKCELAFGYQGALGAWLKFDPRPIHSDEAIVGFCKAWRKEHPAITALWANLERAAIQAVEHPGRVCPVYPSGIEFQMIDEWLTMRAPNGARIWYFQPQLRVGMPHWHKPAALLDSDGEPNPCNLGTCKCKPRAQLTYMAQKEGQWKRVSTYGGKLDENACQFVSREILEPAKRRLANNGYHPILTVYDELVTEEYENFGSPEEFKQIILDTEDWCRAWPIDADVGKPALRYSK